MFCQQDICGNNNDSMAGSCSCILSIILLNFPSKLQAKFKLSKVNRKFSGWCSSNKLSM